MHFGKVGPASRAIGMTGLLLLLSLGLPVFPALGWVWGALAGGIAAVLLLDFLFLPSRDALGLEWDLPRYLSRGVTAELRVALNNRGSGKICGLLKQSFEAGSEPRRATAPFAVAARGEEKIVFRFVPRRRGTFSLGETTVRLRSPLKFWWRQSGKISGKEYGVLPGWHHWLPARGLLSPKLADLGLKRVAARGQGTEFDSLRRYVEGDTYRDIDWRATAKRGQVMTRTWQMEKNHDILIGVDCGRLMGTSVGGAAKFDWALGSALSLASYALNQKDGVGFFTFGSRPRAYLPPKKDRAQLRRISEAMSRSAVENGETRFLPAATYLNGRRSKRLLMVFFTDFLDRDTSLGLLTGLFHLAKRHCVLFVGVSDPHVPEAIRGDLSPSLTPHHKAVAFRLRQNRGEVLDLLRKGGMSAVDLHPRRLTAPILLKYMDLKLAGRF